jgi:hypothetical protein
MSVIPPTLPRSDTIFHKLARVSWLTVIVAMVVNVWFGPGSHLRSNPLVTGLVVLVWICIVVGLLSGIVALFGVRRYGRKGILAPALTGICLWVLLVGTAIPTILRARALEHKSATLTPAVHAPNARQIDAPDLGFSFDLPDGYESFDPAMMPKGARFAYLIPSNDPAKRVIVVTPLAGVIPHTSIPPSVLAMNQSVTLAPIPWRGLSIDSFRVPQFASGIRYLSLNVQVPLLAKAIQFGFGGRVDDEASIRATAETLLSSLEGETNW